MKQFYFWVVVILCIIAGCGGKNEASEDVDKRIFQIDSVDHVTGVQRMQVSRIKSDIVCNGKKYQLAIDRSPSDSLARIKSDLGIFADNRIVVKITREGGSELFSKVFTKQNFSEQVSGRYFTHSILEGIVYDDEKSADSKNIILAASISFPMTDLYIPFMISITPDGKMTILKDEDLGELPPLPEDSFNE